jgi:hypothetical protein
VATGQVKDDTTGLKVQMEHHRNDGWMRVGEEEKKQFPFSQLGDRSKGATIPCHGCLVRYQSGGSGRRRLMRRITRGDDVASLSHFDRPRS